MRLSRSGLPFAAAVVWTSVWTSPVLAEDFVGGIEDLPLMPGLSEQTDARVVFGVASGRFVRAEAAGNVSPQQVTAFYADTLPQLGWCGEAANAFFREGEHLAIEFADGDGPGLTVRFTVEPATSGGCR